MQPAIYCHHQVLCAGHTCVCHTHATGHATVFMAPSPQTCEWWNTRCCDCGSYVTREGMISALSSFSRQSPSTQPDLDGDVAMQRMVPFPSSIVPVSSMQNPVSISLQFLVFCSFVFFLTASGSKSFFLLLLPFTHSFSYLYYFKYWLFLFSVLFLASISHLPRKSQSLE